MDNDVKEGEKKNLCRAGCGTELPKFEFYCIKCQKKKSAKCISKMARQVVQSKPSMKTGGVKSSFES